MNNTSTSGTNSTTICHPLLYTLGNLTLDDYRDNTYSSTSSLRGICPDTLFNTLFAAIFIFLLFIITAFSFSVLIWKRKHPHIEKRNLGSSLLHVIASFILVLVICLRYFVTRKIHPCSLHMLSFFMLIPIVFLAPIFRCWRVFIMYRLNLERHMIYRASSGNVHATALDHHHVLATTFVNSHDNNQLTDMPNVKTEFPQKNGMESHTVSSNGGCVDVPSTDLAALPPSNTNNNTGNTVVSFKLDQPISSSTHNTDLEFESESVFSFSEISDVTAKKIRIMSFLASNKFICITYGVLLFVHFCLWLIFGGVDEGVVKATNGNRVFTIEVSFFDFTQGCTSSASMVYVVGVISALYILTEIATLILCFLAQRDTYRIKVEAIIIIGCQVIGLTLYVIGGAVPIYKSLADYFFTYAFFPVLYIMVDVFIGVTLPCCYALYEEIYVVRKRNVNNNTGSENNHSVLEQFLNKKKYFEMLLEFAKRSYCPESVLAYRDIEQFKKTGKRNRNRYGQYILKTYCLPNSPAQLNLSSNITEQVKEWTESLEKKSDVVVETNLFDSLQQHCLIDLTDVFERLKWSNKEVREVCRELSKHC